MPGKTPSKKGAAKAKVVKGKQVEKAVTQLAKARAVLAQADEKKKRKKQVKEAAELRAKEVEEQEQAVPFYEIFRFQLSFS